MFKDAATTCSSCGTKYAIPATVKDQTVEICGACHPIYTGEYRGLMASGRVDRFRKMVESSAKKKEAIQARPAKKKKK